ncbi:MAG: GGDEF domain-containing protein [Oligoflexia bacterium]|nr:GGDEF domain-containing protein [Oligoflexia bacterium]
MIKKKVIFLDDEPKTNTKFLKTLEKCGYQVVAPKTKEEALYEASMGGAQLLVHCAHTTKTYWEICETLLNNHLDLPSIHIAISRAAEEFQSQFKGPFHQKLRPLSSEKEFLKKVRKLLSFAQIKNENKFLKRKIEIYQKLEPLFETTQLFELKQKATLLFLDLFKAQNVFYFDKGEVDAFLNKNLNEADVIDINNLIRVEHKVIVAKDINENEIKNILSNATKLLPEGWQGRKNSAFSAFNKETSFILIPICSSYHKQVVGHALVVNPQLYGNLVINKLVPFLQKVIGRHAGHVLSLNQARDLSYIDDLTDLYNQRYLRLVLEKEINRSKRDKGCFSVLFMDIDHFKRVNDTRGHIVGSQVLVNLSKIIHENIRTVDYGFRYGGDEFLVVLVGTDSEQAKVVAERMRAQVENSVFDVNGIQIKVTLSIGIASFPEHASTKEEIIELADQAMYVGKKKSRNIVYVAS